MTARHKGDTAKTISSSKAFLGVEGSVDIRSLTDYPINFIDYPFTVNNFPFQKYLWIVKKIQPKYCVAPDIEEKKNFEKIIEQADILKEYSNEVIVVPKAVHPQKIPNRFIVGYPNQPTFGSNSRYGVMDFQQADRIHILGGGPSSQVKIGKHFRNVVSLDTASIMIGIQNYDIWRRGKWIHTKVRDLYTRLLISLNNMYIFWNEIPKHLWNKYLPKIELNPKIPEKIECLICGERWSESENIMEINEVNNNDLIKYICPNCHTINVRMLEKN